MSSTIDSTNVPPNDSIDQTNKHTNTSDSNEQDIEECEAGDTFEGIFGDVFTRQNVLKIPYIDEIENELIAAQKEANMSTLYQINGSYFVETERMSDDEELMQYEVYKEDQDKAEGMWSDDEDMADLPLDVTIQLVPQGMIINSNVYLTEAQWHTVSSIEELFCCQVCQVYCDQVKLEEHVKTKAHQDNLDKCQPIRQYDLSIVRKIKNYLHCGVCNEMFLDTQFREHESTKTHEGNLLAAINRVSDLMYDSNLKKNNYEDYNIDSQRNILTERFLASETNRQASERQNNQTLSANNQIVSRNNQTLSANNQIVSRNNQTVSANNQYGSNNRVFDKNVRSHSLDSNLDNRGFPELRKNNNNVYNNANISVYDDYSDNEEYVTPFEGVSYASMASKPRIELPKYLKIDLGTKEVRVKFESWHMLITPEKNKLYCMVCEESDLIRNKSKHVTSAGHVNRLAACSVLAAYDHYLVRMVNDKLYHCGHCNNLQYHHQMESHIDAVHPKKAKIIDTTIPAQNNNIVFDKLKTVPAKLDVPIIDKNVFGEIVISPFGSEVKISAVSYNIIIQRNGEAFCAVCDTLCSDVKTHVEELRHIEIINMTPFIRLFKSHLTRAVRGTLHCALCNELILVSNIYIHNLEPRHTTALAAALGMKRNRKPANIKKVSKANTGNTASKSVNTVKIKDGGEQDFTLALKDALKLATQNTEKVPLTPKNRAALSQKIEMDLKSENTETAKENKLRNNQFRTANFGQVQSQSNVLQTGQLNGQKILNPEQNLQVPNWLAQNQKTIRPSSPLLPLPKPSPMPLLQIGQNSQTAQTSLLGIPPLLPLRRPHHLSPPQNLPQSGQNISPLLPTPNLPNFGYPGQNALLGKPPPLLNQNIPIPGQNFNYPNISNFNPNPYFKYPNLTAFRPNSPILKPFNPENKENIHNNARIDKNPVLNIGNTTEDDKKVAENSTSVKKTDKTKVDAKIPVKDNKKIKENKFSVNLSESDEEETTFNEEEFVLLTLKTSYFKVPNLSYNSLVYVDNGVRHCFVCSTLVKHDKYQQHMDSRDHMKNIKKTKFLDKYSGQLFRQMYLMYHCTVCNVIMTGKEIKIHLDWPPHNDTYSTSHNIVNKKNRKELKSGLKVYAVETQKETIFHNVNEPEIKVMYSYQIVPGLKTKDSKTTQRAIKSPTKESKRRNKLIIYKNSVLKIPYDNWHGIAVQKNGTKCLLCEVTLKLDHVSSHVATDYHVELLGRTFEEKYYPALMRKISQNTINCVFCNSELPNNDSMIWIHVKGRKHIKNHEDIIRESANPESYSDCYEDVLNL